MMEEIPLSLVLADTVVSRPTYYWFQDNALIGEWSVWIVTYRIAEIMAIACRVAEVILAFVLVHPTCLEEAMWIVSRQDLAILIHDDNWLWHLSKLLHIIGHHCHT